MVNHGKLAAELLNDAKQVHGNPNSANTLALIGIGNALLQIAEQLGRLVQDDGRLTTKSRISPNLVRGRFTAADSLDSGTSGGDGAEPRAGDRSGQATLARP